MMKRIFDILAALGLLVLFFPLFFLVAIVVRVSLGSPIFFRQQRPGIYGKSFELLKFRTMTDESDDLGQLLSPGDRVTATGSFLRQLSLDEIPQLLNVLRGDMSLVGPRPLLMEYLPLYNDEQARRHNVKPGITGWAQVNGRNAITWEEKFNYDIWYVDHHNFWLDLKILGLTILKVIQRAHINKLEEGKKIVGMGRFKGTENFSDK